MLRRLFYLPVISLLLFILSPSSISAADKDKAPAIKFETTTIDLGNIREADGTARTAFKFKNTGTAPLIILKSTTSCGCTTAKGPEKPIAPGAEGEINVTFSPTGRQGEFIKTIIVRTNIPGATSPRLKIKGCVIPKSK